MPADFMVRPYQASDEQGLLAAWNEAMWADPLDAATWRSRYLLDPNFTAESCPVAIDSKTSEVVGFALGYSLGAGGAQAWVVGFGVLGSHRRRGIGRALFSHLESMWRPNGVTQVLIGPYVPSYIAPGVDEHAYADAIQFLHATGGETTSRPLSMKASLTGYRSHDSVPDLAIRLETDGVTVRPVQPMDILPLLQFLDEHFEHWRGDATAVLADIFGGDPRAVSMYVAEDNGELIGYAQSRNERFGPFGVNERYRGRGIGAVLLSRTLVAMRSRGFHCAWFLWTSDRAAKLYRDHGFEEVRRFALVAKTLQPQQDR
jgi:GNAT superfamily N-acetyltransferase